MDETQKGHVVQYPHIDHANRNRVLAVFECSAAVFDLPRAATLGELAGRLAHLSERHDGALTSVDIRLGAPGATTTHAQFPGREQ